MYEKRKKYSLLDLMKEHMEEIEGLADKLMEYAFTERPSWNTDSCCLESLCNVSVTPEEVVITADLPNAEHESVKVEVLSEELIAITARMKRKMLLDDFGITHHKGEFSSLHCQPHVPVPINTKRMKMSFKQGILEIRFPRKGDHVTEDK